MTIRILTLTAIVVFAADRATKIGVVDGLRLAERGVVDVIPGVFSFTMAWNRGVNFGLFAAESPLLRWGLTGLAVAISAVVALWAVRRGGMVFAVGAGALVGGALGNALDRALHGAVMDFLNVTCCGLRNPYAFNIADIAIFAGAAALALAPDTARRVAPRGPSR